MGRFKGEHVTFHGKLKKPVLMRRSGVGTIRDSSTRPMSKSEAATMHVSQVPLGIPVTAVDSDGEEEGMSIDSHSVQISQMGDSSSHNHSTGGSAIKGERSAEAQEGRSAAAGAAARAVGNAKAAAATAAANVNAGGRLGVATPPLSDESHARNNGRKQRDSMDSDDSETMLPWARASSGSVASSAGSVQAAPPAKLDTGGVKSGTAQKTSHLPPSPISSAESPINARDQTGAAALHSSNNNGTRPGHGSTTSSIDTTNTSESDDDPHNRRRDQTFSIYDVYGRDSVAFPNFDFRELNIRKSPGGRVLASNMSMESLNSSRASNMSGNSIGNPNLRIAPSSPLANGARNLTPTSNKTASDATGMASNEAGRMQIPAALRTPLGQATIGSAASHGCGRSLNTASQGGSQQQCDLVTASPGLQRGHESERLFWIDAFCGRRW